MLASKEKIIRSWLGLAASVLLAVSATGCATHYVDTALKDVPPEQMARVKDPKPVQLLFEFQSKGATNARATDRLKEKTTEIVTKSGLFSQVASTPVAGNAILSIVINNVPVTDNAYSKGFVTGLTFGLAGNTVTDGYICTVDYLPGGDAPKISATVRHAIHTTIGAEGTPRNAVKSASIAEAVETMVRQIVTNGLNMVASDGAFNK